MLSYALTPEELEGKWYWSNQENGEAQVPMKVYYIYDKEGNMKSHAVISIIQTENGWTVEFNINTITPGTYTIDGDNLTNTLDISNIEVFCNKDDIKLLKTETPITPEQESMALEMLAKTINATFISQMKANYSKPELKDLFAGIISEKMD